MTERRLYRSRNAVLGGVCAGIAERIDADAIVVRILAILLCLVTLGLVVLVYVALWARLPLEPEGPEPFDVMPERAESSAYGVVPFDEGDAAERRLLNGASRSEGLPIVVRLAVAVALMLLFLVVSMNVSPFLPGSLWWQFWPLGIMIVGLFLIVIPIKGSSEALWHALGIMLTSLSAMLLPAALGIVSWEVLPGTIVSIWPILAVVVVALAIGIVFKDGRIVIAASILFAMLCLLTLYFIAMSSAPDAMMRITYGERAFVHL